VKIKGYTDIRGIGADSMGTIAPRQKNLWGRCTQVAPLEFCYVIFETVKCTFKVQIYHYASDNKKLSYCWETVRRESMPRIAEMDVEMTT